MFEHLKEQKESVIKGFEKAEIMTAVKSSQDIYTRYENPFDDRTWIKLFSRKFLSLFHDEVFPDKVLERGAYLRSGSTY